MGKRSIDLSEDINIGQMVSRRIAEAFKYGIECDLIHGKMIEGGSEQGIHKVSDSQNYVLGTRRITPDGRVFRYAKSGGACYTGQGSAFYQDKAISANCKKSEEATSKQITIASRSFAKNELKGGYISIFGNPDDVADNANCPHRLITGNNLCSDEDIIIDLEDAVGCAVAAGKLCEVYYNPYRDLRLGTKTSESFAGLAAVYVDDADKYFWVQTWGPVWVATQVASFNSGEYRDAYFRHDGSIQAYSKDQTDAYALNKQRAGFIIPPGLTAGPLLMLQISP